MAVSRPILWFAARSRYRTDIEAAATNSKINFVPLDESEDHGTADRGVVNEISLRASARCLRGLDVGMEARFRRSQCVAGR